MAQYPTSFNSQLPSKALAATQLGKQGDLLISGLHGNKYNRAYNGALFLGANSAGVTTSAGLATTYVGICLSNPAANTFNLVLRRVSGMVTVITAAVAGVGLITGYVAGGVTAHTTALTPANAIIGVTGTATAKLDSACTIVGTPAWTMFFGSTPTATTNPSFSYDLEGSIILPPGAYAAIGTTVPSSSSGFWGSMEWEEVPV